MENKNEIKPPTIFGWHTIIDLNNCNDKIRDEVELKIYAKELCKVIDMIPFGEPQTPYFGEKSEITKGYSLLQFVETSSITGHFSDYYRSAHIDIFSCKEYNYIKAIEFTKSFFNGRVINTLFQIRYCE